MARSGNSKLFLCWRKGVHSIFLRVRLTLLLAIRGRLDLHELKRSKPYPNNRKSARTYSKCACCASIELCPNVPVTPPNCA